MAVVMTMVLSTMSMALAQEVDWLDDVIAEDNTTTTTPRPFEPDPDPEPPLIPQEASITLTGPEFLDVGEEGTYTVEVTNDSTSRDLDEWVLGLSVTNIADADDLTIVFTSGDGFDITDGTAGVDVQVDTDNDIIYLRGSNDPTIGIDATATFTFDASFAKEGSFTGTAYVIDEDPFRGVEVEEGSAGDPNPFFSANWTNPDGSGITKPLSADGSEFEAGATYEFDFCTLDRTRWALDGTRVLSLNNQKCYTNGVLEYQHRGLLMNSAHPDFAKYADAGHVLGFNGAWLMLSFDVIVPGGITVDETDASALSTWSDFG